MKNFIITTDSTVDLPKEFLIEKNVPFLPLSYIIEDKVYADMDGLSCKEFMNLIRAGAMPTTSQVNPDQAKEFFESLIKEGNDILHIAFTSGLSGTYNSERIAAEELMEEYPETKIVVIDSLCASMGQGLLLYKALELRDEGADFETIKNWVLENRSHICHNVTIDDLNHLHRGGRVSKTSAILGTLVNIKPILHINHEGRLVVFNKVRGRKKSIAYLLERMEKQMQGFENTVAMIVHGDVPEEAEQVKRQITERFGIQNVIVNGIGSVIGSHTGPGVLSIFYMGNEANS